MVLPPVPRVEKCDRRRPFGWTIIRIITTMPMRPPGVVVVVAAEWEEGVSVEAVREGLQWRGYCIVLGLGAVQEEAAGVCPWLVGMACR